MYGNIPNQRIPIAQKGPIWKKDTVDAYLSLSNEGTTRKENLQILYDYYNGMINSTDYDYVMKPYGKARKNFPSKMRNYPLIKPTLDLLLGEKAKRPFNYSVIALNSDSVDRKEKEKQELFFENMKQQFANELIQLGVSEEQIKEVPLPENLEDMFEKSYVDNRAVVGQKAMTYIIQNAEVHEKLQKAWFHFLVSGEAFTERGVHHNEPFYDVLNPLDVDYDMDPDLDYVEDGDWVKVTKWMAPSSIVERWGDKLTETQIDTLFVDEGDQSWFSTANLNEGNRSLGRSRLRKVQILYWQSMERKGFLEYMDPETGSIEVEEVEDGFRLPREMKEEMGAKVTWEWGNRPWQAVRIGDDSDGMDIDVRPVEYERNTIENQSANKLPINGRRYSDINSNNISLVMLGIPYQLNYNVTKYRLELSVARSKDIIAQLDINLIPKKWDMDKFMYYVEGSGIAWVDYNKEGVKLAPNHQSVMDLSVKTISLYIEMLNHIEEEWERVSGVNRQRRGEISQYEGKAMGQQAIVQSAHTTEDLYRKFAGMEKRDLQALLDYSKYAWRNGKKGMYIMPDGRNDLLDIDPIEWMESELGVFISDATKDVEKINLAREAAQGMIQKGAPGSMVLEMFNEESFITIIDKLKKAEKQLDAAAQQAAQGEQESVQANIEADAAKQQKELDDNEKDRQSKESEGEKNRQNAITLKQMDIAAKQAEPRPEAMQSAPAQDNSGDLAIKTAQVNQKSRELDMKSSDAGAKSQETAIKAAQQDQAQSEVERHNKATEQISKAKPKGPSK